jgi:hypothetical protein
MAIQDHTPITTTSFEGIYDRSVPEDVPFKNLIDGLNLKFSDGVFETREGSVLDLSLSNIVRVREFTPEGQAPRTLVLTWNGVTGNLYDASISSSVPIYTLTGMSDFSVVTLNNRAYITPHNGIAGIAGAFVQVYDGSTLRKAAGAYPATGVTCNDTGDVGKIEEGIHCIGVVYETTTGFLTGFSPITEYDAPGGQTLLITNVPVGPTGTAKRHIIATRVILNYTGDTQNQAYYFVPFGTIDDNVTTSITVNFYDADLIESADYLQDTLADIPAGLGLIDYQGRMVVWGFNSEPDVVRVSFPGEPENFSAVEGFLTVGPDSVGRVQKCFTYRTQLVMCKSVRSYYTVATVSEPLYWKVDDIDFAKGAYPHSVGTILNTEGSNVQDVVVVCDISGIHLFVGNYAEKYELSYKIENIWNRVNKPYLHKVECVIDPFRKRIYISIPLDNAVENNYILYGDYSNGLDKEAIRWCLWSFATTDPKTIYCSVNYTTKKSILKYAGTNIYRLEDTTRNDAAFAINNYARFAYSGTGFPGQLMHYPGARLLIRGSGSLSSTVYTLRDARTVTPAVRTLSLNPEGFLTLGFNLDTERASVKISLNSAGSYMIVSSFTLFAKPVWTTRPNE